MLLRWKHVAIAIAAAVILGFVFAWSGIMGIGARSGHWAVTDWFLHWVMRNSVATAALETEAPPFDNPEMLKMAAGHYEQGCAYCHGSPAEARSQVPRNMLPQPPDLKEKVPEWTSEQLFHIVQDGVRFTGMPAWPAQHREDEVWAMIAFLERLPNMDAQEYRQLAGLAAPASSSTVLTCQSCHAKERLNGLSLVPSLAGQSETYLRDSLAAYVDGRRLSGVMQTAIAGLSKAELDRLAQEYAAMPRQTLPKDESNPRGANILKGRELAEKGRATDRIPACLTCHDREGGNPAYPRLKGQSVAYLAAQLRLFRSEHRGGGAYAHLMLPAANPLTDADIENVSAYFASGQR